MVVGGAVAAVVFVIWLLERSDRKALEREWRDYLLERERVEDENAKRRELGLMPIPGGGRPAGPCPAPLIGKLARLRR